MPIYIRRLPGEKSLLMDTQQYPQQFKFYNPSAAGDWIYIRITEHTSNAMKNKILMYNAKSKTTSTVDCPWDKLAPSMNLFQGIEDLRLCLFKDRLWFTAATTHASDSMGNELLLGYFNDSVTTVEYLTVLDIGSRPVKNVCPFVFCNQLRLFDMFQQKIYQVYEDLDALEDEEKYVAATVKQLKVVCNAGPLMATSDTKFRGSTSPVHLHGNTWGVIAHDIIFNDTPNILMRCSYVHHWIEFDIVRGVITFISRPFFVAHWGIEYISGIQYDKNKSNPVSLYIGIDDKQPLLCKTTLAHLRVGK
jgi:hypothetical protein